MIRSHLKRQARITVSIGLDNVRHDGYVCIYCYMPCQACYSLGDRGDDNGLRHSYKSGVSQYALQQGNLLTVRAHLTNLQRSLVRRLLCMGLFCAEPKVTSLLLPIGLPH